MFGRLQLIEVSDTIEKVDNTINVTKQKNRKRVEAGKKTFEVKMLKLKQHILKNNEIQPVKDENNYLNITGPPVIIVVSICLFYCYKRSV